MWVPEVSVLERVARGAIGYLFLLVAFRISGKRQVGQLTPFDLVVLLIISNVLQNAMIGPDNSVTGGVIGALTIFVMNGALAWLTFKSRRLERLIEGEATRLVHDGKIDEAAMRKELVTHAELRAALREAGIPHVTEARFAMLESTGRITAGAMHTT
ncbi:MAG TPA: YetF domain-containing protein [Candidatus Eisenbacteria bacterium]|nr:YetF domain-containing protein [Candidatus Eisenbacteria bacterium]